MNKELMLFFSVFVVLLSGCRSSFAPTHGHPAIDQIHGALMHDTLTDQRLDRPAKRGIPSDISQALLPDLTTPGVARDDLSKARRFNISVQDVPAQLFFMGLVRGTKLNIAVSPQVKGLISLDLKEVTLSEVLDVVRDTYGYQYRKTLYGYRIFPSGLQTRIFHVDYLDITRSGQSNTLVSSGQVDRSSNPTSGTNSASTTPSPPPSTTGSQSSPSDLSSGIQTHSNSNFWEQLTETLKAIVGTTEDRKLVINPQAGVIIVRAYPAELEKIAQFLNAIQKTMGRQVILEAKILEVKLNDDFQSGIDWNVLGLGQQSTALTFMDDLTPLTSNIFALNIESGQSFNLLLKLLSTQGNVQVLSSPRISTLNNQKAVIKVGSDEFFITNVSSTSAITSASATNVSQDITLTPFFSGIALDVTPQISEDGNVTLHIHPSISKVTDKNKEFTLNGSPQDLPLAFSTIRESDTIVHAKNGQFIIIGGMMQNETSENMASVPVLGKLPLVGSLFRRVGQTSLKTELVILLRPLVVNNGVWTHELNKTTHQFNRLERGYHYGAHPKIFGNLAESEQ